MSAMESDVYIMTTVYTWYVYSHMVAGYVTDPLDDAKYILIRLATTAPNTNNYLETDD